MRSQSQLRNDKYIMMFQHFELGPVFEVESEYTRPSTMSVYDRRWFPLLDQEVQPIHGLTLLVKERPRPAHCEARANFDQGKERSHFAVLSQL